MEQTIYSTPSDYPHGKFQFLQWGNFLGEFKTEIDKARARANLGIPDSYSFNWGNIGGNIQNQTDLIQLIEQVVSGNTRDYTNLTNKVTSFETLLNNYSSRLLSTETTANNVQAAINAVDLLNIRSEILSLKINVAQNSTDIARLSDITSGDDSINLVELVSRVNTLEGTVQAHGVQIAAKADSAIVNTKADASTVSQLQQTLTSLQSSTQNALSALEVRIATLENSTGVKTLVRIEASSNNISATEGDNPKSITINAVYSDDSRTNINQFVTANSSSDSIATYSNGKINITGVGTANIIFEYNSMQTIVTVTVTAQSVPQNVYQYLGYANNYGQVLDNSNFRCNTVKGTWNPNATPIINAAAPYYFFIITTEQISSVIELGGLVSYTLTPNESNTIYDSAVLSNVSNQTYNIYKIGPLRVANSTITIN